MLRRCRGSGSEERSASGGEPLPAGPLRAVRGYAVRIVQDIVVAGRVTTSDEAGNFFRSVVLQEDGTGVELMAGLDDLFRVYPPGCRIAVRLQGLAMCRRFGVVQIGTMPAAGGLCRGSHRCPCPARPVRRLRNRRCSPSRSPDRRFRRTCARHVRLPGADRGSDAASVGRGSDGLEMGRLSAVRGPGRKQDRHLYEHLCPVCGFGNSEGARLRWSAFCSTAMPGRSENPI